MRQGMEIELNWLTALIGFNLLLFIIPTGLDSFIGGGFTQFMLVLGALDTSSIFVTGELWRVVTSNFLHVDLLHFGFNMLALWNLGVVIYQYYGGRMLLSFYVICGSVGSILSVFFLGPALTVGASGAVFGLIGVLLGNLVRKNPSSMELPFSLWDILPIAIYSLLFGFIPGTNINNIAHFGGLGMGFLLGYFTNHKITFTRANAKREQYLENVMYWGSLTVLVVSYAFVILNIANFISILT